MPRRSPGPLAPSTAAPSPAVLHTVSERLVASILDGTYGPGARLPAERELGEQLGVSRVVVREALRRLQEWRIVQTRRGSGATVLPRRRWTAMALGASLSHALTTGAQDLAAHLIRDALALRRALLLELIERAAPPLAGTSLDEARAAVDRAWARRRDVRAFLDEDRELIGRILEQAGLLASLWTLNSLAETYLAAMSLLGGRFRAPAQYVAAMQAMVSALEAGDGAGARRALADYLDDLDRAVAAALPADLQRRRGG